MSRKVAKDIAKTISNRELLEMFNQAKNNIKDWTKTSSVNKSITKGVAWNILVADFDVNNDYSMLTKVNMIREFGLFLPDELKPKKKQKTNNIKPYHQEPKFND